MLNAGVTVTRTTDDLVRYHAKMLIVDREELHVYGFNYTSLDLTSRRFGIVARDRKYVQEALRLFDAYAPRQAFDPSIDAPAVSPLHAREQLTKSSKPANKTLAMRAR